MPTLTAAGDDDGRRLDRILRKALRDLPISAIHRLLRTGAVLVNGEIAAAGRRIRAGETITVADTVMDGSETNALAGVFAQPKHQSQKPARIPDLVTDTILFEGAGLLILNKAAGLEVHGRGSLEEQVRSYLKPKLPPSLSFRPGPLHRLDKPSSGIIVFSTNLEGARLFSSLMRERKIAKHYLALVEGIIEKEEIWRDELIRDRSRNKTFAMDPGAMMVESSRPAGEFSQAAGKTALTRVSPLARGGAGKAGACTLCRVEIETGRTHQIRAQAASHGHPLRGDKKYGSRTSNRGFCNGFLLHAWRMEFPLDIPPDSPFPRIVEAPLPGYFQRIIRELFGEKVTELFGNSISRT